MTRAPSTLCDSAREIYVAGRFDALHERFRPEVGPDDARLRGLVDRLGPLAGRLILDLGCGKGRFAARLAELGARVVGVDLSQSMLARSRGLDRVRASARRLPLADATFDAVIAVEVFEHLDAFGPVLDEARRVLKPGGRLAVIDKNAGSLNARRPWMPNLVVKWIDERRGLWMYPAQGPVRERWLWPGAFRRELGRRFDGVSVDYLLSADERGHAVFRGVPAARRMILWTARVPGGRAA